MTRRTQADVSRRTYLKLTGGSAAVGLTGVAGCLGDGGDDTTLTPGTAPGFPPFEMQQDGELVGFDIDLLEAVVDETSYELGEWATFDFDGLILDTETAHYQTWRDLYAEYIATRRYTEEAAALLKKLEVIANQWQRDRSGIDADFLDARDARGHGRQTAELEAAEAAAVLRHLALALHDVDIHRGLPLAEGGELLGRAVDAHHLTVAGEAVLDVADAAARGPDVADAHGRHGVALVAGGGLHVGRGTVGRRLVAADEADLGAHLARQLVGRDVELGADEHVLEVEPVRDEGGAGEAALDHHVGAEAPDLGVGDEDTLGHAVVRAATGRLDRITRAPGQEPGDEEEGENGVAHGSEASLEAQGPYETVCGAGWEHKRTGCFYLAVFCTILGKSLDLQDFAEVHAQRVRSRQGRSVGASTKHTA